MLISEIINISDPVIVFDRIMEEIEITKYLKTAAYRVGRKRYNSVNMLRTILFGFLDKGYISIRKLEDECKVTIRYMYLMDYESRHIKQIRLQKLLEFSTYAVWGTGELYPFLNDCLIFCKT